MVGACGIKKAWAHIHGEASYGMVTDFSYLLGYCDGSFSVAVWRPAKLGSDDLSCAFRLDVMSAGSEDIVKALSG
ncbi:unnamed protein product [Angiostrongylus costaricensis]|uniref:DDE Tnp4 domain-containing protein n=1 Tax=Angiostrongylus costaricensis TaxID=334426 RepID=A0A0R3Q201_ANGCS|nr:unnamed protein product [Angiostrongylus costaricensis]